MSLLRQRRAAQATMCGSAAQLGDARLALEVFRGTQALSIEHTPV